LVMTAYIMLPTGIASGQVIAEALQNKKPVLSQIQDIAEPFVQFIERVATRENVEFFRDSAKRMWGDDIARDVLDPEAKPLTRMAVLMPAFIISELTRAFQIGFLLYLPFIVIDLIVANILLALGMSSLSPVTVSLPLKLLLFIALDGWKRLLEAMVLSYGIT